MEYTLKILFTADVLNTIYASANKVILAQTTNLTWIAMMPLQQNTITWQDAYGMYASAQEMTTGETLIPYLSSAPAPTVEGALYKLDSSGDITGPKSGGTSGAYSLHNKYEVQPSVSVGLLQDATVNGTLINDAPIMAETLVIQSTVVMTPLSTTTIYLWLATGINSGGTMIGNISSPLTTLVYSNGVSQITVQYNQATGLFDIVD